MRSDRALIVCKWQPDLLAALVEMTSEIYLILDDWDMDYGGASAVVSEQFRQIYRVSSFDSIEELAAVAVDLEQRGAVIGKVLSHTEFSQFGAGYLELLLGLADDPLRHVAHRDKRLMKERAEHPRDPKTYTAIDLNPDFRARMKDLLGKVAPGGTCDPAKVGEYVENFRKAVLTNGKATFAVKGEFDGKQVKLSGETSDRKYHDQLIDMLVAMKLYNVSNDVRFPKAP